MTMLIEELQDNSPDHPAIDSLQEGVARPFWSVMIPSYNRKTYLKKTIMSVLENVFLKDDVQVEIIDNCSTEGDIEKIVREISDPRVTFYRQSRHVSMSENWTTCIQRAKGQWIHILHDDDMVFPDFYKRYSDFIRTHPDADMVFSRSIIVDENDRWTTIMNDKRIPSSDGTLENAPGNLLSGNFICTPSVVVSRRMYETAGGFSARFEYSPDWEMWIRIASTGRIGYIDQPLSLYRIHPGAETHKYIANGVIYKECTDIFNLYKNKIPKERLREIRRNAYRNFSRYAIANSFTFLDLKKYKLSIAHAIWAIKLDLSVKSTMYFVIVLGLVTRRKFFGFLKI
jgi:glycosyltransferase involved in cell wall biosynthesis